MVDKVQALLDEYEARQTAGKLETFSVKFALNRLIVLSKPDGEVKEESVLLTPDLHQTLQIFFSDVESIPCGSFDYTTLKSLLNAHSTLERMAQSTGKPKTNP